MRLGTRSLLFGAHQVVLHPLGVTLAWRKLFDRWPDWVELVAIAVHDWGYWGCESMDGEDGAEHPYLGAEITYRVVHAFTGRFEVAVSASAEVLGHSRTYCLHHGVQISRLYAADKLGGEWWPWWVYLPMTWLTGELAEYRERAARGCGGVPAESGHRAWYRWLQGVQRVNAERAVRCSR